MSLPALVLLQLAALLGLLAAAATTGMLVTRRLPMRDRAERWAISLPVGLGTLGTGLFSIGLAGGLHRWVILILAGGVALAVWRIGIPSDSEGAGGGVQRWSRGLLVLLFSTLLPTFVWSLYPPSGFDATAYHLPFARAFVDAHGLVVVPGVLFPVFPQLAELLFAAMVLVTGVDVTTHLVQLLALGSGALLLHAAGRRFYSPRAGLLAAALWIAHPLVHYQAASAYVDVTLALFCLLAVIAWECWRDEDRWGWLAVAGAAAGFAAGTKYLGLIWGGLLALTTLVAARRGRRVAGLSAFVVVALLVAAPWYVRIHHHTGNPVHPFFGPLFSGANVSWIDQWIGLEADAGGGRLRRAVAERLVQVATAPGELVAFAWNASFSPHTFDRQSPLAPWHLLLAPVAAVFAWRDRRLLRWLLLVVAYAALWTTSDPRFQLPSAALMALVGAGALEHVARRLPRLGALASSRVAVLCAAAVIAAPGPLYASFKVLRLRVLPPATAAAREAFLDATVPGHRELRTFEARHGASYRLFALGARHLTYHARGEIVGSPFGFYDPHRVRPWLGSPERLHRELRAMGVTALLVTAEDRHLVRADERFRAHFRVVYRDRRLGFYELLPRP